MSDVLVDSSVWIDFFRGEKQAVARLDELIDQDRAAVTGCIVAEVASGALTRSAFSQVRSHLLALSLLPEPAELWDHVSEARFVLARQGIQAHLIDLSIATIANLNGHSLLTRDKDFKAIARVISIDVELF